MSKFDSVECGRCKDGHHLAGPNERGCEGRACSCWCRLPSQPFAKPERIVAHYSEPEVGALLARLREAGIVARGRVSCQADEHTFAVIDGKRWRFKPAPTPMVVFKPSPDKWPASLLGAAAPHMGALAYLLVPERRGRVVSRSWWFTGKLGACVGCGHGSALYDPLGECRHNWCGWLGQVPDDVFIPGHQVPQRQVHSNVGSKRSSPRRRT